MKKYPKQTNNVLTPETLSFEAVGALRKLDESFIGTDNYMGIGWFWAYEYRHYMRDATYASRRLVYKKLREAGLETNGESAQHLAIIQRYHKLPKWIAASGKAHI